MKLQLGIGLFVSLSINAFAANYDFLAQKSITIRAADPVAVIDRTTDNVKAIFEKYEPKLDSSSKIVQPLRVGGTQSNPVVKVSIRKCVGLICQVVDLDTEVSIREVSGNCQRNFMMLADLSRSSKALSDVYDRLDVSICYNGIRASEARLDLNAQARHDAKYSTGIVQRQILDFLQLQIQPITDALSKTLRENGSQSIRVD
jgi:hypothetical protein